MSDDLYAILGVPADADAATLRAAYRRRARQTHPDHGGSAEEFHHVQAAWEVLGEESTRAEYDRRRRSGTSEESPSAPTEEGSGFTYSRSTATRRPAPRTGDRKQRRSAAADQPPVYQPPLSEPQPLSLTLTSQKVHGEFRRSGLFGAGRSQRLHTRTVELLQRHLLEQLPAARLFNDVHLGPPGRDRKGRLQHPKGGERAEHVVIAGTSLVVVAALEVPATAAAWDGRALRVAGRRITPPNLAAQAAKLRTTLAGLLPEGSPAGAGVKVSSQLILHAADGDLFHPVVETQGQGRYADPPLAAGRAVGHIANALSSSERANLVDRHLMAALRTQLAAPEAS
ncbi:J domain-containing protein [Nesterenkonia alba]|uniref:J domain-containing protein n=1 Tax=Nesterenkonia alba TaxID=515814 RepID=UPI0003B49742|nr:DnaJ domain-containing protein [Nesterenkonia alba]